MASFYSYRAIAHVYIFLRADGLRKFGWTVDVRQRRANLTMQEAIQHEIEACWQSDERTILGVESAVHNKLRPLRFRGHSSIELYDLPFDRLVEEVEAAFALQGVVPAAIWKPRDYSDEDVMAAIAEHGVNRASEQLRMGQTQVLRRRNAYLAKQEMAITAQEQLA